MIIKGEDTIFLLFVFVVLLIVVSLLFLFCLLFCSEWICFLSDWLRYPSMRMTNVWSPITSRSRNLFYFDPLCWVSFVNRMSVLPLGQWTTAVFSERRVWVTYTNFVQGHCSNTNTRTRDIPLRHHSSRQDYNCWSLPLQIQRWEFRPDRDLSGIIPRQYL